VEQWDHGGGFSLDATVRIEAKGRRGLERLLRYCARPPFAAERIEELHQHRLVYHLPRPGPDGRTQLFLSPLELIQKRDRGIFVMLGFEDGVVAYGPDAERAGTLMIGIPARAL